MSVVHRVADTAGAVALAELLNGDDRRRPVVVVTTPAGRTTPFIDAGTVLEEVGDLADVYLLATGPHTWTFSNAMPERTQVYGGAGRVYPLGHAWVSDPRRSPLRFAYDEEEGRRSTRQLISDALRMAAEARGTAPAPPPPRRLRVRGEVAGIIEDRALVRIDGGIATIAQELTLPGVPLSRLLTTGLEVEGWSDPDSRRLDVRESLLPAGAALAGYRVGDVVLAEVATVLAARAELMLHPDLLVVVTRARVTGNDLDDLRTLLTPGEVVPARVAATCPGWSLTLVDVDDDEDVRPAAALLPGGPPWLLPPPPLDRAAEWAEEPAPALAQVPSEAVAPARPPSGEPAGAGEQPPRAVPTPALLARRAAARPSGGPGEPTPDVAAMTLTIGSLRVELAEMATRVTALEDQLRASNAERDSLVRARHDQQRRMSQLEEDLRMQRSQLRKARRPAAASGAGPAFADPELGFRHAVLTAWATRTPVGEQAARPLPDYDIGPDFLTSLASVPGVSVPKVADVVFEVLTGRAHELSGRELHPLRESGAGNAATVRRPSDGATCWRAALQVKSPQARRLHYWVLPGGRIELSRVVLHDDVRP